MDVRPVVETGYENMILARLGTRSVLINLMITIALAALVLI